MRWDTYVLCIMMIHKAICFDLVEARRIPGACL